MAKQKIVRVLVTSHGVVDPLGFEYPKDSILNVVKTPQIDTYLEEGVLKIKNKKASTGE